MTAENPNVDPTTAAQDPWAAAPGTPMVPSAYAAPAAAGPIGKVRGTGFGILMTIVTFGLYPLYWYYATHDEMKRHSSSGLGGGLALVIAIFVGIASPFLSSNEVGGLYERRGQDKPVSWVTGLWYFPGIFLLVLPIVWFVKTNGALNDYWRSLGAQ